MHVRIKASAAAHTWENSEMRVQVLLTTVHLYLYYLSRRRPRRRIGDRPDPDQAAASSAPRRAGRRPRPLRRRHNRPCRPHRPTRGPHSSDRSGRNPPACLQAPRGHPRAPALPEAALVTTSAPVAISANARACIWRSGYGVSRCHSAGTAARSSSLAGCRPVQQQQADAVSNTDDCPVPRGAEGIGMVSRGAGGANKGGFDKGCCFHAPAACASACS